MSNNLDNLSTEELKEAMKAALASPVQDETPVTPPAKKRRKAFTDVPAAATTEPPVFRALPEEPEDWTADTIPETVSEPEGPEEETPSVTEAEVPGYESTPWDPYEEGEDEEETPYRHPGEGERVLQYGAELGDYGDYQYEEYEDTHYEDDFSSEEEENDFPNELEPPRQSPISSMYHVTRKSQATETPGQDPHTKRSVNRYDRYFRGITSVPVEPAESPAASATENGWLPTGEQAPANRKSFYMHVYNESPAKETLEEVQKRREAVKTAAILIKSPAPMQTEKEKIIRNLEDVIVEMDRQATHERHLPHCRAYTNLAVIKKPTYQTPTTGKNRKPLVIFLLILSTVGSLAAGLMTNAYHYAGNGANKELTPLQCLIRALIPEVGGEYNFSLLPLDTDYFLTGAGVVFGIVLFIGALIWITMTQNEQSRIGHEHGEKHIATASDVKKYKNQFMD